MSDEIIQRRIERITSNEHILATIQELAERARRRWKEKDSSKSLIAVGYIQAIQLILDLTTYEQARQLVEDEWI